MLIRASASWQLGQINGRGAAGFSGLREVQQEVQQTASSNAVIHLASPVFFSLPCPARSPQIRGDRSIPHPAKRLVEKPINGPAGRGAGPTRAPGPLRAARAHQGHQQAECPLDRRAIAHTRANPAIATWTRFDPFARQGLGGGVLTADGGGWRGPASDGGDDLVGMPQQRRCHARPSLARFTRPPAPLERALGSLGFHGRSAPGTGPTGIPCLPSLRLAGLRLAPGCDGCTRPPTTCQGGTARRRTAKTGNAPSWHASHSTPHTWPAALVRNRGETYLPREGGVAGVQVCVLHRNENRYPETTACPGVDTVQACRWYVHTHT